jgi:glycosyltransferase involved in cell wall biosynthesis
MARPTVSACVITLNEEANIRDCLDSVRWADEIVLVDSFSTDRTVEIAREYTDRVFQRTWNGINEQRQFCLEQATGDWVFCIDADERVTPELRDEIMALLGRPDPGAEAFETPRRTWCHGRWIRHCGWYPGHKTRLFRRDRGRFGDNDPHDQVLIDGRVARLNGELLHYTYRDLAHHANTVNSFSTTAAKRLFQRGRRGGVAAMVLKPPWRFFWQYVLRLGFLDGVPGLIICLMSAYSVFLRSAKLWEMTRQERQGFAEGKG